VRAVLDTSPISYLLLIGEIEILPVLYEQLFIPPAVSVELRHPGAPPVLKDWMARPPAWLEVHPIHLRPSWDLAQLQAGERESIFLAEDLGADQVVLDDMAAREAALGRGLGVTGLVGILDQAGRRSLIDLPAAIERLQRTNFHVAPWLLKNLLDRYA
jgi:predicted nucleic acid-binding protein